ncbi:MAG: hypothetical protein AUH42_02795 [Gemmatimonadetes bacterium 13_1_40CM_70_11]|nr:MAG: hypothetical protein AUH42_02795 [Gemmatimonadetes bacterium 13_1_40CM_70_11]
MTKRYFDVFWSVLGLAVLSPLLLVAGLIVKAEDGGPVFFRQTRVGYRGRPFRIWKFRTMALSVASGGLQLTVGDDRRVTRAGAWLRRFKLDELPQLFNVVAGEMSLVGPRPELPCYVARYTAAERKVLELIPGITGVASLWYRNESQMLGRAVDPERTYVEDFMPAKIRLSLAYAAGATVWTDFRVVATTLRRIFLPASGMLTADARPAAHGTPDRTVAR